MRSPREDLPTRNTGASSVGKSLPPPPGSPTPSLAMRGAAASVPPGESTRVPAPRRAPGGRGLVGGVRRGPPGVPGPWWLRGCPCVTPHSGAWVRAEQCKRTPGHGVGARRRVNVTLRGTGVRGHVEIRAQDLRGHLHTQVWTCGTVRVSAGAVHVSGGFSSPAPPHAPHGHVHHSLNA